MKTRIIRDKRSCVILLCTLVFAYAYICMSKNCFSSSMVFIVNEGLLTKFQTGVITASFYVVYALLQVVGGMLTDRWNPERFITLGLVGAGLSNLVIYFNQSYPVMLASWVINACLQFAVWPATFKIVSTLLREDMQENALLIATFGNPIGVVLGYTLAAFVGTAWQLNFLASAVGLFIIAIGWEALIGYLRPRIEIVELPKPQRLSSEHQESAEFFKMAVKAGLIMLLILSFTRTMFDLGIKAVAPSMINESYDDISPAFATALSIIILVSAAAGPLFSRLIYPRLVRNEAVIITAFFLVCIPLTAAMLLIGRVHYVVIVILLSLVVMIMSAASLFTTSYISARFNKWGKGATVAGILNASASLGVVAANTLFTGLADTVGWYGTITVWLVIMVISLVIAAINIPMWTKFLKSR